MKKTLKNFIIPCFFSLLISFSAFFITMNLVFMPNSRESEVVQKNEYDIPYFTDEAKNIPLFINIEYCPIDFLINISVKQKNISVNYITDFNNEENIKSIRFTHSGLENVINFLGGIEIETPYGLPSPYNDQTTLAKDERLLAFGTSIRKIFTEDASPTAEKKEYYCYILEELCIKFLDDCTTENYKFLKQNCETDISYTEFYDNLQSIKNIKR